MPYALRQSGSGYKVGKKGSSKTFSEKPMSKAKAKRQMAALYANESLFSHKLDQVLILLESAAELAALQPLVTRDLLRQYAGSRDERIRQALDNLDQEYEGFLRLHKSLDRQNALEAFFYYKQHGRYPPWLAREEPQPSSFGRKEADALAFATQRKRHL